MLTKEVVRADKAITAYQHTLLAQIALLRPLASYALISHSRISNRILVLKYLFFRRNAKAAKELSASSKYLHELFTDVLQIPGQYPGVPTPFFTPPPPPPSPPLPLPPSHLVLILFLPLCDSFSYLLCL